jgi:hypothetical protein
MVAFCVTTSGAEAQNRKERSIAALEAPHHPKASFHSEFSK